MLVIKIWQNILKDANMSRHVNKTRICWYPPEIDRKNLFCLSLSLGFDFLLLQHMRMGWVMESWEH